MQKLITIYLDSERLRDQQVREHLKEFLSAGWTINSIAGFGGHSQKYHARGWFAIVLERQSTQNSSPEA